MGRELSGRDDLWFLYGSIYEVWSSLAEVKVGVDIDMDATGVSDMSRRHWEVVPVFQPEMRTPHAHAYRVLASQGAPSRAHGLT
jgi:hypothetical protein